jgi:predicted nucleotidyltransferase
MKQIGELLQAREKAGIESLVSRLSAALGTNLVGVWLFGSKARGDAGEDSDVDLLVIVAYLVPPVRWRIRELAADCSLEYDLLINTHILDNKRWAAHVYYASTLWREIIRDGVVLHEAAVAAPLD